MESTNVLTKKNITRVVLEAFPKFLSLISRPFVQFELIGANGGSIKSTLVPGVEIIVTPSALTRETQIGLQVQLVPNRVMREVLGSEYECSHVVSVLPKNRKFHKPITIIMPSSKIYENSQINLAANQTHRLLCSGPGINLDINLIKCYKLI